MFASNLSTSGCLRHSTWFPYFRPTFCISSRAVSDSKSFTLEMLAMLVKKASTFESGVCKTGTLADNSRRIACFVGSSRASSLSGR